MRKRLSPTAGILKQPGTALIHKPCQEGVRGEREVGVYKQLATLHDGQRSEQEVQLLSRLKELSPAFHGTHSMNIHGDDVDFMILEDFTSTYKLPVILDVKMGQVTYDPDASEAKKRTETDKYAPQKKLGFRICGYRHTVMPTYHLNGTLLGVPRDEDISNLVSKMHSGTGQIVHKDKSWGKSFDEKNVSQAFHEYFSARTGDEHLKQTLQQLQDVLAWFNTQRLFHFYSSSLLFIYEADPSRPPHVNIRLIDFSHVFPARGELDSNYIPGIHTLISLVTSCINNTPKL